MAKRQQRVPEETRPEPDAPPGAPSSRSTERLTEREAAGANTASGAPSLETSRHAPQTLATEAARSEGERETRAGGFGGPAHRRGFTRPPGWGPHSLRARFALGYTLVALFAITAIALVAIFTVAINFGRFQGDQLSAQAGELASQLGQQMTSPQDSLARALFTVLPSQRDRLRNQVWVMGTQRQVVVASNDLAFTPTSQDGAIIFQALTQALGGQEVGGTLPGNGEHFLWFDYSERPYVATPIHAGGQSSGQIVGAVALVTPVSRPGAPPGYVGQVLRVLLFTVLGAALAIGLFGALLARSITRPVEQLTLAAAGMAAGEYSQRVTVQTQDEIGRLANAFNEMAAALERDVGELRRQEVLRRELVANVSHDLATPLTAIQGFSEALADGVIEGQQQQEETLRLIAKEVVRLRRLVNGLNQLSRVESPNMSLSLAPLSLAGLVDETLAVLQPELEEKGVQAHNTLTPETPPVLADSDKLTQVLLNLLDNALRYTPKGGSITISATPAGERLRVSVRDTGSGIAAEDARRIFDRFYRADTSRNTATGGSGLGLAIVKAIIEAHGGTVGVESTSGKGTTLWFTLAKA